LEIFLFSRQAFVVQMMVSEGKRLKAAMASFFAAGEEGQPLPHIRYRQVLNPALAQKITTTFYVDTKFKKGNRDIWNFRIYSTAAGRKLLFSFVIKSNDFSSTGKFKIGCSSNFKEAQNSKILSYFIHSKNFFTSLH
jgi:hypothetical protein